VAERVLEHEIEVLGLDDISVSSAGLFAVQGAGPDPVMVGYLEKKGIPIGGHRARQITGEDVEWADLILVMERDQGKRIEAMWPETSGKVVHLGKFISGSQDQTGQDIMDPFGRSPYHYRLAQAQIGLAIKSFVRRVLIEGEMP